MRVDLLELRLFLFQFIDIKFSLTYCLVHIVCYPWDFYSFWSIIKLFWTFFNVMNCQLCWSVADPVFPFWVMAFWKSGALSQTTTLNIPMQYGDIYFASLDIVLWKELISLFGFFQLFLQTLFFWKKFLNFKFVQTLNSRSFFYGIHETQTQNLLIPRTSHFWNLIIFALETCCFLLGIQGFWIWVSYFLWLMFVLILLFWAWWSF